MRVQANSFRLPVLQLQPKESRYFSQEQIDYNQSNQSIKYNSSPLRNGQPLKKRVRGMTIAIYNSQEKLKTSEFRYCSNPSTQFITQSQHNLHQNQNNNSMSVQNTVRRYRSKLKSMVYHQPEELSRDPRIYSFKEPAATIRLTKLTDNENKKEDSQAFKNRIRMLMGKIQMLLQSQCFYQAQNVQEKFQVSLVKLRDEYDCLSEDFNDFYVSKKKLDQQVLSLLNHMEIIKKLLKPPPRQDVKLPKPQTVVNFQQEVVSTPTLPPQEEVPPLEIPLVEEEPEKEPTRKESSVIYQQDLPTPISSSVFRGDETQSQISEVDASVSPSSRKKSRTKIRVDRTPKEGMLLHLQSIDSDSTKKQIRSNYGDEGEDSSPYQSSYRLNSNRAQLSRQPSMKTQPISEQEQQEQQEQQQEEVDSPSKPPLKRTATSLGSVSKRRSTMIQPGADRRLKGRGKGARTISERDDSQFDSDEYDDADEENQDQIMEEKDNEELQLNFGILDKLINSENVYQYQYYQTWDLHIEWIMEGKVFGEFDL